jgi:hypothetical protein
MALKKTNAHRGLLACALLCTGASGCVRTVQAWPPPLPSGTSVTVRFASPRSIAFEVEAGRDSVAAVRELEGTVVSLQGETLVVRVTRIPDRATEGRDISHRRANFRGTCPVGQLRATHRQSLDVDRQTNLIPLVPW